MTSISRNLAALGMMLSLSHDKIDGDRRIVLNEIRKMQRSCIEKYQAILKSDGIEKHVLTAMQMISEVKEVTSEVFLMNVARYLTLKDPGTEMQSTLGTHFEVSGTVDKLLGRIIQMLDRCHVLTNDLLHEADRVQWTTQSDKLSYSMIVLVKFMDRLSQEINRQAVVFDRMRDMLEKGALPSNTEMDM